MVEQRRARLRTGLRHHGLAAFIGMSAANFRYLSGAPSAFLELSHQLVGTDMVLVPADDGQRSVLLVNEYSAAEIAALSDVSDIRVISNWTENRPFKVVASTDAKPIARPEQFDVDELHDALRLALADLDLDGRPIGVDLTSVPEPVYSRLSAALAPNTLVDATMLLYDLRAHKDAIEIQALREAAALFDAGISACFDAARKNITAAELQNSFENAVRRAGKTTPDATFFFPHVGTPGDAVLRQGDVLKIDAGARVGGYWSDGCRHAVLGAPEPEARLTHDALYAGFSAARDLLRPGVPMRRVYDSAVNTVRAHGLPGYSRGHVGHSIGLDNHQEEPPFLGPNDSLLVAGMVICLELPFYPPDVGGFNIEDMFLITEDGAECLTHYTREFQELQ